ncbi:MAG: hypothetical protein ABI920_05800 [Casimicrobiaceae bacterium]
MNLAATTGISDPRQIAFAASPELLAVVAGMGRTEDVAFSPSNRRIAFAGFGHNKIIVFDVQLDVVAGGTRVRLTDWVEMKSPSLKRPHGLVFIDEKTLVVANRAGDAPIFEVPASGLREKACVVQPLQTIRCDDAHHLRWPGSVTASSIGGDRYELLVCNNYIHRVSRHVVERNEKGLVLESHEILLGEGLSVPDGVAIDRRREWIAISNHGTHTVLLYENTPSLDLHAKPDGILRNVNYPHGVRFTADGAFLLVADAGSPYLNVYARGASWRGARQPHTAIRLLDETTFERGRYHPTEGGPKGIDIDQGMNVLVTTCWEQGLAFFDLPAILREHRVPIGWIGKAIQWRYERTRDDLRRRRGWK